MKRFATTALSAVAVLAAASTLAFAGGAIDCRNDPCPSFTAATRVEFFKPDDPKYRQNVHGLVGQLVMLRRDAPDYQERRRLLISLIDGMANLGDPGVAQAMLEHDFGLTDDEKARFKKIVDRGSAPDTKVIQVWKENKETKQKK